MGWFGHRLVGALACLALLTAAGRGLCFMQATPDPTGTADAHDCCKKGLNDRAPSCCHAESSSNALATVKKTTTIPFPSDAWAPSQSATWVSRDLVRPRTAGSHSPPPTVLRI